MTQEQDRIWYAALKAKDARFDGHFFVGISSTGIYCRPVCRARLPKAENCTFYKTAAAAEQAGYRPCLLCRPELAPGYAPIDACASLAQRAAKLLEDNSGAEHSLDVLAARLGCSARHLRRVFVAEYTVSPIQYLQTSRLLFAKKLLTETNISMIDVAMTAGFGSLRRFNDLFKKQYHLAPTALRKQANDPKVEGEEITLLLSYRPPYLWDNMLNFLDSRAIPGIEMVKDDCYWRTVRVMGKNSKYVQGWLRVAHLPEKNALTVTISSSLLPALHQILLRLRHLFDLHCDPLIIDETLASMNDIRPNLCTVGMRLPGCFEGYEMAVRAILGQQITVKAARTLASRITQVYGRRVDTGVEGLTHVFPSPHDMVALEGAIADHLGPLGVTGARANTILELACALVQERIHFDGGNQAELEMKKLMDVSGIGPWTAHYIAMRAMGWPDAFPHTDYGVKKALAPRTTKEMLALAETWRPWRSYATINLWNSLSSLAQQKEK